MGAVVTAFVGIYMLWFVIPVGKTAYNLEVNNLNMSSSTMQVIKPITDNFWIIFPLLIIMLVGYTIWLYATNRDAFDY